jgi:regulator of RNase E activity RraA
MLFCFSSLSFALTDTGTVLALGVQIWACGTSTVGAGGSSTPWAVQVPITTQGGTVIHPGDIVFCDEANGVVVIPRDKVAVVLDLLPRLTAADDRVKEAVQSGMLVYEAFKMHRSSL